MASLKNFLLFSSLSSPSRFMLTPTSPFFVESKSKKTQSEVFLIAAGLCEYCAFAFSSRCFLVLFLFTRRNAYWMSFSVWCNGIQGTVLGEMKCNLSLCDVEAFLAGRTDKENSYFSKACARHCIALLGFGRNELAERLTGFGKPYSLATMCSIVLVPQLVGQSLFS